MDDYIKLLLTMHRHRSYVVDGLEQVSDELRRRGRVHDRSKYQFDEFEGFSEINKTAREHPYGSKEYEDSLNSAKTPDGCITKHFVRNSHHPEFFIDNPEHYDGIEEMGWLDLIEMVIDWHSAALTYDNGTGALRKSVVVQKKRFAFTEGQWWLIDQVVDYLEPPELLDEDPGWPRVRYLAPQEQEPFAAWLKENGASRPVLEGVDDDEQDGYHEYFYQQWKAEFETLD